MLIAGVDSSTQSTKVLIVNSISGELVRSGMAPHPSGTEVDPQSWWQALLIAIDQAGGLDDVAAISVAAQQHGLILLDKNGEVIRPALLWNDTRSAIQSDAINKYFGNEEIVNRVGSLLVASFTVTKLAWVVENEIENARNIAAICLPHEWLSWKLLGTKDLSLLVSDRSDASGTGYFNATSNKYDYELLSYVLKRKVDESSLKLGRILTPNELAGVTACAELPKGIKVGAGAADNAAAGFGLMISPSDLVLSVGTSGTAFTASNQAPDDTTGCVTGFADCTGKFLPLLCTLNASLVFEAGAKLLNLSYDELSTNALAAPAGASGIKVLPYFVGERTPNIPNANAVISGITLNNFTTANLARALIESVALSLAAASENLKARNLDFNRVLLIGGAARNVAVVQIFASVFGGKITLPRAAEYVALGAARQAAWALAADLEPPLWKFEADEVIAPDTSHLLPAYLDLESKFIKGS